MYHGSRSRRFCPTTVLGLSALGVLCCLAFSPCLADETQNSSRNLLANPSFEETAGDGTDEKLVPGWSLQFRAKTTDPALTAEEVSIIDDPAQAHSGKRCLRIKPAGRNIGLFSPEREKAYASGLYEVSAWVRGNRGTKGVFGTPCLNACNNFWGVTEQWQKIRFTVYFRGGYVHPSNSRTLLTVSAEGKAPLLYVDDLSVVRLNCGLADVFDDHMVLQRNKPVPVWGWSKDADRKIAVTFRGQTRAATADKDGRWEVTLAPMPAGGPFVLELDGRPAAYDVMLGDVLALQRAVEHGNGRGQDARHLRHRARGARRGQSSPDPPLACLKAVQPPACRAYLVRQDSYLAEFQAHWNVCTPETIARGQWGGFSALGYFFGREIQADQKVAIGLMQVAHGATAIEAWMSAEALRKIPPEELTRPSLRRSSATGSRLRPSETG